MQISAQEMLTVYNSRIVLRVQPRRLVPADAVDVVLGQAGKRPAGQKLRAQPRRKLVAQRVVRAVDGPPVAAQNGQNILCAGLAAEQRLQPRGRNADDQIAQGCAVRVGEQGRALQNCVGGGLFTGNINQLVFGGLRRFV